MEGIDDLCLVDDDEIFQMLAQRILEKTPKVKNIRTFSNGYEAMQYLDSTVRMEGKLPDVILLDLNMPVMDGWDFIEEYLKLHPSHRKKIDLFVVTSSNNKADIERANKISDVTNYIVKPLSKETFYDIVDDIVK